MRSNRRAGDGLPGLRIETWGTRRGWGTQVEVNVLNDCACLRERSDWRWELSFI